MSDRQAGALMIIYRAITSLAALLVPFILTGVLRIYNQLESYGNRLTAIETRQEAMVADQSRQDKQIDQLTKDNNEVKQVMWSEVYPYVRPHLYGK